jgi:hypothetical protein
MIGSREAIIEQVIRNFLSRLESSEPLILLAVDKFFSKDKKNHARDLRQLIRETSCPDKSIETTQEEVEQYVTEIERWLTSTWECFEARFEFETAHARTIEFFLEVHNNGRVPADNVRFDISLDAGPAALLSEPAEPDMAIRIFPTWPPARTGVASAHTPRVRPGGLPPPPFEYLFFQEQRKSFFRALGYSGLPPGIEKNSLWDWRCENGVYSSRYGPLKRLLHGSRKMLVPFCISFRDQTVQNVTVRYSLHADHADPVCGDLFITVKETHPASCSPRRGRRASFSQYIRALRTSLSRNS